MQEAQETGACVVRIGNQASAGRRRCGVEAGEQGAQVRGGRPGQRRVPDPYPRQLQSGGQPGHLRRGRGAATAEKLHATLVPGVHISFRKGLAREAFLRTGITARA